MNNMDANKEKNFEKELADLINRYNKEQDSDTPDFILARYLTNCLAIYNQAAMDKKCLIDKSLSVSMNILNQGEEEINNRIKQRIEQFKILDGK